MRFKRGSKVEIASTREMPISWRCAEIISGNGQTYNVRYNGQPSLTSELVIEGVPRKAIRPCPPPMKGASSWVAGDIVEVFDDNSWKIAIILKVLTGEYYLVRLLGVTQEFRIHRLNIRVRLSWNDGEWVVIEKGPGSCANVNCNKLQASNCYQKTSFVPTKGDEKRNMLAGDDRWHIWNAAGLQESNVASKKMVKRTSPYCSSLLEAYPVNFQKKRAIEKDGRNHKVVPVSLLDKVDATVYPRYALDENVMHASFKNRLNGYHEPEKEKENGIAGCSLARSLEPNDSDSYACSVGSCSVTNKSPNERAGCYVSQETTTLSYAESFYNSGEEENFSSPPEEEAAESIHRLELHAYRCTLEALHASGPLSWEQEALLTNLRIMLHISNDEHLLELRNLISARTAIHIS